MSRNARKYIALREWARLVRGTSSADASDVIKTLNEDTKAPDREFDLTDARDVIGDGPGADDGG